MEGSEEEGVGDGVGDEVGYVDDTGEIRGFKTD